MLQIGQTEDVMDEEDDGVPEEDMCEEWHDGVFRADKPADSAIWRRGTDGRDRRLLCVCMKSFAISSQRDWLYSACRRLVLQPRMQFEVEESKIVPHM